MTNSEKKFFINFDNIKKFILDHITLYTILLIFIGYWNLHSFFMFFGINIYNYITTTEIILSFIPIILKLILISILILIGFLILKTIDKLFDFLPAQKRYEAKIQEETNLSRDELIKKYKERFKVNLFFKLIVIVFFTIAYWSNFTLKYPYHFFMIFYFGILFQYIRDSVVDYNILYKGKIFDKTKYRMTHTILISFIFLYVLFYENFCEANLVLNNKSKYDFSFHIDSITYKSDSNLVYVGETQNYLILRDNNSGYNSIFKKDNIKELQIKKFKENFFLDELIFNGKVTRSKE